MYGPPPHRKRNLRTPQVGLRKCIRPLLEWITPGQDGMRCALFSINWSVAKDYFRFRIWRAPGSTVVPSPHSPADLAGNRDLAVVARLQPHRLILDADMYGPPPRRKRNLKTPQVGLRKCIRPLLEWITPGQDGMRCALFSINWSVAKDYFRFRIWRAPGSTVVPSPHSPADLAGNHDLAVVARLQPHRPILGADMVHSWRVRPRRFERVC